MSRNAPLKISRFFLLSDPLRLLIGALHLMHSVQLLKRLYYAKFYIMINF